MLLSKFCRQVEKRFSRYSRESAFNLANEQRFTLKYLTFYYYHESKSFIAINGINLQVINGIQVNFCGKTKSIGVV